MNKDVYVPQEYRTPWARWKPERARRKAGDELLVLEADREALRAKLEADVAQWLAAGNAIDELPAPPEKPVLGPRPAFEGWT